MDTDFLNEVLGSLQRPKKARKKKTKRTRFQILKDNATLRNMVLERYRKRIDGVFYGFELTNNSTGVTNLCTNLNEVYDEIFSTPIPEESNE